MFDCLSGFVCGSVACFLFFTNEYCQKIAQEGATNLFLFYIDIQLYIKKALSGSTFSWFQSKKNLEYIKDGRVVYTGRYDGEEDLSFMNKEKNYLWDFFVYTHNKNKVVHRSFPEKLYEYVVSKEHFIMAEVSFKGSRQFKVQFKTADYNYMIIGNRFNHDFIVYFLRKHYYYLSLFYDMDSYSFNIIDKDANIIMLDKESSLLFTEDGYVIETHKE